MSDGYDFSPSYHASLVSYSPGTTFLATVYQNRVIIRSTSTLQIVRTWSCNQPSSIASTSRDIQEQVKIDSVEWSEDGLYILAFSSSIKTAWVFALATNGDGDSGEIAKIGGEGVEGLIKVEWGRSGKTILAWSDFNLKLSIFDLSSGITRIIQNPKSHLQCHTYSSDNRYMAIVEKHLGKEFIGIYDVLDNHHLVRHFQLSTSDVQGMSWSPDGKYLAVWDSALSYSIYIYSPIGPLLSHFTHTSLTFSPESLSEDPGLGIRTVTWAPGGRWLAIGGWDGKVRILESTGWRCIALLNNPSRITEKDTVWKEPQDWVKDTRGHGIVQFDRMQCPAAIPNSRPDLSKVNPNMGISQISFDKDGALFAVCSESTPNALHIYTFLKSPTAEGPEISHLTTLLFANLVKTVMWCPGTKGRKLAVTAKSQALYLWDEEGNWEEENTKETGQLSVGIEKGSNFSAVDLQWAPDGSSLVLQDKSQFCLLYDNDSDTNQVTLDRSGMWTPAGEGLSHVMEEEEYEDGWSGYGLNLRQGFSSGIPA
uniref:Anaphase-promoting complex subunit 4 WD40 domain-containing protein n=1 Tax=Kwoniella pini CBS 10737 TaxID=1296096 RepID=A0A1B9HSV4_9TREE|nr:uncharacterized protein I206_07581 [Kwoniella pini CBS 10737]OCF46348.1 hypothetical protein I206_07581 [Kwoniella pini CBS 10737]